MAITVDKKDGSTISIVLEERFDFGSVDEFRKCYESLTGLSRKTIAMDFRSTRYIDSSALGMLINAKSYFTREEASVKIINANDQIKKIFSISRFDKKFDIE